MNHVVLIGFMGSGKSTIGPLLAERLGRRFLDLDSAIEGEAGMSIATIFEQEGETGFRRREAACLNRLMRAEGQVVAVGGGAPLSDENWRAMRDGNLVVALTASREILAVRLDGATDRPLLTGGVRSAIDRLLPARDLRYRDADLLVETDARSPVEVAETIAERLPASQLERIPVGVHGHPHEIVVGAGLRHLAGPGLRRAGVSGAVVIASDATVLARHAPDLSAALVDAGFRVACYTLPSGEPAKSIDAVADLYRFLARSGVDRQGAMVALGGGAVGDAAGFAAATWLRGIPLLQVPTTLLAIVDSSIGGKNGVNLEAGKNLVGTVHQPCLILADIEYLKTLEDGEYGAAWAEVIKSAIIADTDLFDTLDVGRDAARSRDPAFLRRTIAATCAIKARIVEADPFETGVRAILNYGHTVGHALEAALGYGALRHGEAVAWGMQVASDLSLRTGRCLASVVEQQDRVLHAYGLLAERPRVDRARLYQAMRHDKKARDGEIRWVLLTGIGRAESGCRVPWADVERSLDAVLA